MGPSRATCRSHLGVDLPDYVLLLRLTWIMEVVACSQHEPQYCGRDGEGAGQAATAVSPGVLAPSPPRSSMCTQSHLRNVLVPRGGLQMWEGKQHPDARELLGVRQCDPVALHLPAALTSIDLPSTSFQSNSLGSSSRLFCGAGTWLKYISSGGTCLFCLRQPARASGSPARSSARQALDTSRRVMAACAQIVVAC